MQDIRNEILAEFESLDVFKYTNAPARDFDQKSCETIVKEALHHHCKGHQYSNVIKTQLINIYGNGFVEICGHKHPYEPHNIFWRMEDVINNRAIHKPFKKKNSLLFNKEIYHTHHSQSFYSMYNCIRYFKDKYRDDHDVYNRLKKLKQEHPEVANIMPVFAHEVLLESISWSKKTGEWVVYQKCGNKIRFLCLYIHDYEDKNDEQLFSLIKEEICT